MLIDRAYRALSGQNSPFLLDSKRSPGLTAGRILTKFGMNVVHERASIVPDFLKIWVNLLKKKKKKSAQRFALFYNFNIFW